MKGKRLTLAIVLLALVASLATCRKEEYARRPMYGDIYCRTPNPRAGDTVVLAARVIDPGNRIYHAEYSWHGMEQFIGINPTRVTAPNGSKTIEDEPTCTCVFKYPQLYQVKMYVKVDFSMPDQLGAMHGRGVNKNGSTVIFSSINIK